jgi:hypothetical protein
MLNASTIIMSSGLPLLAMGFWATAPSGQARPGARATGAPALGPKKYGAPVRIVLA